MQQSGEIKEKKAAKKVLSLLNRGKHWVLVTLLLSNVITNETLPIVLDRCLGGGWPAVVSSTVAIVIFGEIIPQSISVRYGLSVGAAFAPFVLGLMYIMYPVAYPIALLLDYILGEDHGTIYKRAGLKTLVTLHKTMGVERLNEDEVTIISAVLDLKDKPVATVMTPLDDVFTLPADRVLDEVTIEEILQTGFNRIPIHLPGEPTNFIGMLLVRILISYDPEDALPISSFPLATLPETGPDTSCLNILNYFQEGKSHMVVVSNTPGDPIGALGVLTLEDVIEELIGEEIIDESDVYVDVHRGLRRDQPGPLNKRLMFPNYLASPRPSLTHDGTMSSTNTDGGAHGSTDNFVKPKLNPLNKASNPKQTSNTKVTIKRGHNGPNGQGSIDETQLVDASITGTSTSDVNGSNGYYVSRASGDNESTLKGLNIGASSKEPSSDLVHDGVYGSIHRTETGAIRDSLQPHRLAPGIEVDGDLAFENRAPSPGPEIHSYRTGGIIESVINIQGVHKTIIEDAYSDNDGHNFRSGWSSTQSSIKYPKSPGRYNSTDGDARPLLSDDV